MTTTTNNRRHVEQLLKERQTNRAKGLLTSDKALYDAVVDGIAEGRAALTKITSAVHVLHQAKLSFTHLKQTSKSWIYIRAFGGALIDSPFLRELLLSIKKASPDVLTMLIESIAHLLPEEIASIVTTFGDRAKGLTREEDPMISTSRHDMKRQTSRTTMVAKKVELDSQPSTRSKKNRVISNILDKLHDTFKAYFETTLVDVSDLFLNEILIYDIKSPCRDALMPRPRHAIERALSSPFDYLNCACCTPTNANDNAAEVS